MFPIATAPTGVWVLIYFITLRDLEDYMFIDIWINVKENISVLHIKYVSIAMWESQNTGVWLTNPQSALQSNTWQSTLWLTAESGA